MADIPQAAIGAAARAVHAAQHPWATCHSEPLPQHIEAATAAVDAAAPHLAVAERERIAQLAESLDAKARQCFPSCGCIAGLHWTPFADLIRQEATHD